MFEYQDILKELKEGSASSIRKEMWLFYATAYNGTVLTNGEYNGYGDYCSLDYYYEEISTLTSQDEGVKGITSTNAIITLPKGESSINIYNEFNQNRICNSMRIVQLVTVKNDLKIQQDMKFTNCRIDSFKISMNQVTFTFQYDSRSEAFNVLFSTGTSKGCSVTF